MAYLENVSSMEHVLHYRWKSITEKGEVVYLIWDTKKASELGNSSFASCETFSC
jgi:hypothetical protein